MPRNTVAPPAAASPNAPASAPTNPADVPNVPASASSPCSSDQLAITLGDTDAATGHRFVSITFTNIGETTCSATGYPKVELHDRDGVFLATAAETLTGFGFNQLTEVPTVTLAPSQSAIAVVEGMAWSDEQGASCLPYATLTVIPPAGGTPTDLQWKSGACGGLKVHPIFIWKPAPA